MPMRKKFSTAPCRPRAARPARPGLLSVCLMSALVFGLQGPGSNAAAQGAPTERVAPAGATTPAPATAPAATPRAGDAVFVPGAPDRHTVVRGDTLWGIAGKYLQRPWDWPKIWDMNREQVRNPHLIYPGQVILLNKDTGTMSVAPAAASQTVTGQGSSETVVTLRPSIRSEPGAQAIPSIPPEAIEPFLSQPVLIEPAAALAAPRVIGSADRVLISTGDQMYVAGIRDPNITQYLLYRPGKALIDPDTNAVLGNEAVYLGTARVVRGGEPATLLVTSSTLEIVAGDRLVPATLPGPPSYVPRAPERDIRGRVVSIYGGVARAGRDQIVALNRGAADGIETGHVFALQNLGRTVTDRTNGDPQVMRLPDERNGLMFVFRVFDKVSYALIMNVTGPVAIGDRFIRP